MAIVSYVKYTRCSQDFYDTLEKKDKDTLYFVYTDINASFGKLYLGNKLISTSKKDEEFSLADVDDVFLKKPFKDGQFFIYDEVEQKWTNQTIADAFEIEPMVGATEDTDGLSGLVPVPLAGENNKFLRGDGTWVSVDTQLPIINSAAITSLNGTIGTFTPVPSKYLNISSAISYLDTNFEDLDDRTKWHNI